MTRKTIRTCISVLMCLMLMCGSASAMTIQHNVTALNAHRNLNNYNSSLTKNLEKLSIGYRINRAGDDAAELEISEQMRAQITGLKLAGENAQYGSGMIQTGEEAWEEAQTMLSHSIELGLQSGGSDGSVMSPFVARISADYDFDQFATEGSEAIIGSSGSDGSVMALFVTRTSAGYDFDQFATDGSDAIIGSDNPSAVMVGPKGEIGVVGAGKAFVGLFDGGGNPYGGWTLVTDGNDLFVETESGLRIVRDGLPIQSLTLSIGSTVKLDVQEEQSTRVLVEDTPAEDTRSYPLVQGRLEHVIYNLEMSSENITGAESEIRSVDFGEEMNRSVRQNILMQLAENMPELPQ